MNKSLLLLVGILTSLSWSAGCGEPESDADLPPDLPALAEAPCELTARAYRIDTVVLPSTAQAALELSFDLDRDERGRPDNLAAQTYSMIASQYEGRIEQLDASIEAALADGRVRWILLVETCADGGPYARVGLHRGSDLDGDGVLHILPYGYLPAVGTATDGRVVAADGTAAAPVTTLFDILGIDESPTWIDGYSLSVAIERELDDGAIGGRLGLGMNERAYATAAVPIAAFYTELLALGDSEYALDIDTNADGLITPEELMADELVSALGAPDLDLIAPYDDVDVYWPNRDGVEDSISMAIGFTAVPVELE